MLPHLKAVQLKTCGLVCGTVGMFLIAIGTVTAAEIPLTVTEPTGIARRNDVVTTGVPLPRQALMDTRSIRLVDGEGKDVPADTHITARWDDGSAMWVMLDFQTSLDANQTLNYRLLYGPEVKTQAPAGGIAVTESPESITVNTGALTARVSKRSFSLPETVTLSNGAQILRSAGQMFLDVEHTPPGPPQEENWLRKSGAPARSSADRFAPSGSKKPFVASVEWSGTQRTVIRLDGWQTNTAGREEYPYTVRLTFHAGKPWIWVTHTVVFSTNVKEDFLRRLALRQQFDLTGTRSVLFGGATPTEMPAGTQLASMLERGPSVLRHKVAYPDVQPVAYEISAGRSEKDRMTAGAGNWARGWATLRGERAAATVAIRHFDKLFPKEIAVDAADGTITEYLWPDQGDQVLDLRRRYDGVEDKVHYDLGTYPKGGRGIAKTHELLLWFHDAGRTPAEIENTVAAFNQRLVALAPPEWYSDAGILPRFHRRDVARFPRLETYTDLAMEWRLRNQSQFGWYGFVDFGDILFTGYEMPTQAGDSGPRSWVSRGYMGWLNNDGATDRVTLVQFLRSGDRRLLDYWENLVRHVTDIDTVHYDEDPAAVGGGHRHDQQHWGNFLVGYGTATFGALDMYLLLGDLRCMDVAKEYVSFHVHGGGPEDEYVGEYLARMAAVTGDNSLMAKARENAHGNYYGFNTGDYGQLDRPHFRSPTIQLPSLMGYLLFTRDAEMSARWLEVAHKRMSTLGLGFGGAQYAFAWQLEKDRSFLDALKLIHSMWDPYCKPALEEFWPDKLLKKPLREMTFEELIPLARNSVNNPNATDFSALSYFPYMLAAAVEAGLTEKDLLDSPPRLRKGGWGWDWGWSGAPVKGIDRARVRTLDLRAAANANPWNELRVDGKPAADAAPSAADTLRFDFLGWDDVEPGCYPVREMSVYPVVYRKDFTVREEGSYVYGLPWGGRMELSGVPFDFLHPSANAGKSVVVLHDKESVRIPVGLKTRRLFLLCAADAAQFNHDIGAQLTLRYAGGQTEAQSLRNLEEYERWDYWGFASKASLARAFKVSSYWDGRPTLLSLLEVPARLEPLDSLEIIDAGKGHRLAVLAVSAETDEAVPGGQTRVCDLAARREAGDGWAADAKFAVTPSGTAGFSSSGVYHVDVPAGNYRVDIEASCATGLFEALINGRPVSAPWTLSKECIAPGGTPFERVSVWGRADAKGLDITLQTAPGKGLWRHHVVRRPEFTLKYLAVTPEAPPAFVPTASTPTLAFGWEQEPKDHFNSAAKPFSWHGGPPDARGRMIVIDGKARFKVALDPGRYAISIFSSSLDTELPQVGWVTPAAARVTLADGKSYLLPQPPEKGVSKVDVETTVGDVGLAISFEPAEAGKPWGISLVEVRRR